MVNEPDGRRDDWHERDRSGADWPAGWNRCGAPPENGATPGPHRPGPPRPTADQVPAAARREARRVAARSAAPDGDRRHWWLAAPIVLSLATPLYNRTDPMLFGVPFFYWFQLGLAALCTAVLMAVYLTTRKHP